MQGKFESFIGRVFGRLTVVGLDRDKYGPVWVCRCECGGTARSRSSPLRRGNVRSCGCLRVEFGRSKRLRPYESLYNWLRFRCKRKKSKARCFLSYEQFVEFTKTVACFYCGDLVVWAEFDINANGCACNLDRKDSAGDYTVDNCVVCCFPCNSIKSKISQDIFVAKVKQIAKHLEGDTWKTNQ